MNKKAVGGVALALAGFGLYRLISAQRVRQRELTPTPDKWTTADIPNLSGKVIVITGANSGIGYETALAVAQNGATTILACRSMDKARAALADLQAQVPGARAEIMALDLASLESVRSFAAAFKAKYDRLDVLVNNAGIMMVPYGTTVDGFERQLGTNHLGHFALTGLLFDLLTTTPGARVVNVSSGAHRMGEMDFDNLQYDDGDGYSPTAAYGRSKLANLLFTYELQHRFEAQGSDTLAVSAHPGIAATNLLGHMSDRWYYPLIEAASPFFLQSAAMGALPTLRAAVDPAVVGGQYYGPDGDGEQRGFPVVVPATDSAYNAEDAAQLWRASQELTGVSYGQL